MLRNEAVWALDGLAKGHAPHHGFEEELAAALESIAVTDLPNAEACRLFANDLRGRRAESWAVDDVQRVITQIDAALSQLDAGKVA